MQPKRHRFSMRAGPGGAGRLALPAMLLAALTLSCHRQPDAVSGAEGSPTVTINNLEPRRDTTGAIIDAHEGCLQFFGGRYYLYGTAFGTTDGLTNNSYRVYSSPDLARWTFAGELLPQRPSGFYYRPHVVYNQKTRKFVLWYNWHSNPKPSNGQAGVAISDTPTGPFTIVNTNAHLAGSCPGDGSLFVDDDGTGYFIYTAMGDGYAIRVERLTPDYLDASGKTSAILANGCEAPVLFRRNNLYYALCGPLCAWCPKGSEVQVFTSASPLGPFSTHPESNINRRQENGVPVVAARTNEFTLRSKDSVPIVAGQQTWVAAIPTTEGPVFIWMADRWGSCPDGVKGHDSQFWSAPLKFGPHGEILPVRNIAQWYISWGRGN